MFNVELNDKSIVTGSYLGGGGGGGGQIERIPLLKSITVLELVRFLQNDSLRRPHYFF